MWVCCFKVCVCAALRCVLCVWLYIVFVLVNVCRGFCRRVNSSEGHMNSGAVGVVVTECVEVCSTFCTCQGEDECLVCCEVDEECVTPNATIPLATGSPCSEGICDNVRVLISESGTELCPCVYVTLYMVSCVYVTLYMVTCVYVTLYMVSCVYLTHYLCYPLPVLPFTFMSEFYSRSCTL